MKITDLNFTQHENRQRCSARIVWEDYERNPQELFFETDLAYSKSIHPDPHAFLTAAIIPALYFGERRLQIDGEICPQLKNGLTSVMNLLRYWWYPSHHRNVIIEAKTNKRMPEDAEKRCTAFCFSGGVDSMATLYHNRLEYHKDHPGYLREGLLVFGMEVNNITQFQKVLRIIEVIAKSSDLTFIPVYTNIIELGPENHKTFWHDFWLNQYISAAFAAIAHTFSRRWHRFIINASRDYTSLVPIHGSDPFLTSCFSSWGVDVREEGHNLTRTDKVKLIADWDVAIQYLRVCNRDDRYKDGMLNCGRCEKCLRTMLALESAGALDRATAFPVRRITAQMVDENVSLAGNTALFYEELLPPLRAAGRDDLVQAVERKLIAFRQQAAKEKFRNQIIDFDRKYLGGAVKSIKKRIF